MCITNFGVSDFDWNIAVGCYKTNQAAFISNVMSLVESNGFDGVDIDFEGYETGYQSDYADCVKELATRLHAIGKILSIDTYPYIWNNPSINWWKDWLGYVDFINPMQYRGGELDPTNYYQWTWRQDFGTDLGYKASQIMLSFPGDLDSWPYGKFGDDLLSHIRETQELTKAPGPISIWDCEFQAVGWRTAEVWQALHKIKLTGNSSTVVLAAKSGPQVTLRTPFAKAINGQILISVPTSDSYEVKLYSTRGQRIGVIYKGMIEAGTEPLSILTHSLPTANYLVEITSPKIRSTSLIVIK